MHSVQFLIWCRDYISSYINVGMALWISLSLSVCPYHCVYLCGNINTAALVTITQCHTLVARCSRQLIGPADWVFVTLGPLRCAYPRGSTVEFFWCDWSLSQWPTGFLQCFDAVGWVIWPVKIVPGMTKMSSMTSNLYPLTHSGELQPLYINDMAWHLGCKIHDFL